MEEISTKHRVILRSIFMIIGVILFGTFGYGVIEDWSFLDSFFMTVITISTVGYGTPGDLSEAGKIFTSFLILSSVTVVVYGFSNITAFVVEGRVNEFLRRRRILKAIEKLTGHCIVIGAGTVGLTVAKELARKGKKVVIVDRDEQLISHLLDEEKKNLYYVLGDAKNEEVLMQAGVTRAGGLVTTLDSDAESVFVILTAKSLNPDLNVIARSNEHESIKKLQYAGANNVVPITEIGAHRIVNMLMNPVIVGFLDSITRSGDLELRFEQIVVPEEGFPVDGLTLGEMEIPKKVGLIVIAINNGEKNIFNPSAGTRIYPGYTLMVLGEEEKIEKFNQLLRQGAFSKD